MGSINHPILANTVSLLDNVNCWQKLERSVHSLLSSHLWFWCTKIWFSIFTLTVVLYTLQTPLVYQQRTRPVRHYTSWALPLTVLIVALIEGFRENSQSHCQSTGSKEALTNSPLNWMAHFSSLSRGRKMQREAATTQIMGWSGEEPPANSVISMSFCLYRTLAVH